MSPRDHRTGRRLPGNASGPGVYPPPASLNRVVAVQLSRRTIAALTLAPSLLNEPGARSIHCEQISPNSSRCLGPFAQIATNRPPGARSEGMLDVVDVRAALERRVHHDPVELPEVVQRQEVGAPALLN